MRERERESLVALSVKKTDEPEMMRAHYSVTRFRLRGNLKRRRLLNVNLFRSLGS